ncbi:type II secretion system protein GspM [Piscinibacter gummiphilus]|uniref:Type II secretion system protein GspM n=1 Tax=Piscinibacter gummiphilus TaxID=946333 RepID=A0ABZ0D498_9BURK|nr:type II secretion system protein GspM [Piscinibacter gummiphilus]WOB09554.1 type II secretion system protein GspM [Piscinibacter gummiphilus]
MTMKDRWKQLSARYAALAPRERALLPGAVCFAILMLGHLLVIEPATKERRLLQQRLAQETNDLTVAQAQLTVLQAKLKNPDAEVRAQLEALRLQARNADDQFKKLQGSLVPAQDMSDWLSGLLQAQRGLQLVGLRTLPVTSVTELVDGGKPASPAAAATAATAASAPAADAATPDGWLYRHGVEITVRGSYPELVAYLQTLERMPRRVYWGELKLDAQQSPAVVMTLVVYTLSVEKTWWVI